MKFFTLCICIFLLSCQIDEVPTGSLDINRGPDVMIEKFGMSFLVDDTKEWYMNAGLVHKYTDEGRWIAYSVELETLSEVDKNFYRSDSAYIFERTDMLIGMGNVEIITPNGTLFTHYITWNRQTDEVHAPNEVYVKQIDNELWGSELYTNSSMDFIDLKQVRGRGQSELEIN